MADRNGSGNAPALRLNGGLFVILGEDQHGDDGRLRYPGRVGIKYGRDTKDWVRMSYSDAVQLVQFLNENKDHVNKAVKAEQDRYKVGLL